MYIFSVLRFIGGVCIFLFGMTVMGESLRELGGGRLRGWLGEMCRTPLRGVALGAAVTALVQSSGATTVMAVGFVNSGLMTLGQSVGVMIGANLGTTLTSWLLSLTSLGGVLVFLDPTVFSPLLAIAGIVLIMGSKNEKKRDAGRALLGFTVLIFGMELMSDTVAPLAELPGISEALAALDSPLLGMAAGALLTAVIQSSSASVGILQALAAAGAVTRGAAFPIILGQNIGTCVTALLSGLGAGKNARRAAFVHLYFNLLGSAAALATVWTIGLGGALDDYFLASADAVSIAFMHTAFNVFAAALLLPFSRGLERLAILSVPDRTRRKKRSASATGEAAFDGYSILDDRFLPSPAFAYSMAHAAFYRMYELAKNDFHAAFEQLSEFDDDRLREIEKNERLVDSYKDSIRAYLIKLAERRPSGRLCELIYALYGAAGDAERIGGHALEVARVAERMNAAGHRLDVELAREIAVCRDAVEELLEDAARPSVGGAEAQNADTEALEAAVDRLAAETSRRCLRRLKERGDMLDGAYADEILTAIERIADHGAELAASEGVNAPSGDGHAASGEHAGRLGRDEYFKKH